MRRAVIGALGAAVVAAVLATSGAVAHDGAHCSGRATTPTPLWDQDCDSIRDDAGDNCRPRFLNDFAMRNPDQRDSDADGLGNRCDTDDDDDGVLDGPDNCDTVANPDQADANGDGIGDLCAVDQDADGIVDPRDNCPPRFSTDTAASNPNQLDTDADGYGDICDNDDDEDYFPDGADNCPLEWNQDQADRDRDGRGAACDPGDAPPASAPPPPDRTAPALGLAVARTQRLRELGRSMAVEVRCSEACALQAKLIVKRKTRAAGTATLAGRGTTYVFMRLSMKKLRRLAPVRATLKLTAADGAGNKRTTSRRLKLRR